MATIKNAAYELVNYMVITMKEIYIAHQTFHYMLLAMYIFIGYLHSFGLIKFKQLTIVR